MAIKEIRSTEDIQRLLLMVAQSGLKGTRSKLLAKLKKQKHLSFFTMAWVLAGFAHKLNFGGCCYHCLSKFVYVHEIWRVNLLDAQLGEGRMCPATVI